MCTVTYLPVCNGCIITSSRDEKRQRSKSIEPRMYEVGDTQLIFPKDPDGGGTWIAMKDAANAAVLLNGAFHKHQSSPPYRRSRGLVLLDIISANTPHMFFETVSLNQVEPFTIILLQQYNLFECRWDGNKKYVTHLDTAQAAIWSSATLYDAPVRNKRAQWFGHWLRSHEHPRQEDIIHFHRFAGDGDRENDIQVNRAGELFTVSITSMQLQRAGSVITHLDLPSSETAAKKLHEPAIYMS